MHQLWNRVSAETAVIRHGLQSSLRPLKHCWFIIKDILTTLRIEIDVPGIVLIFWKMSLLFNLQKKEPSRECFNRSEGMLGICICFPSLDLHS